MGCGFYENVGSVPGKFLIEDWRGGAVANSAFAPAQ